MIRSVLLAVVLIIVVLTIAVKRRKSPVRIRPSWRKEFGMTLLGMVAIITWLASRTIMARLGLPETGPGVVYERYMALLFGALTAVVAAGKRRNVVAWFAGGIWILFAALIPLLFLSKLYDALCPFCRKGIIAEARACPHCQRDLGRLGAG
ncbi:MAG: hypothetical protein ACE5JN_06575 [Candidatus Methylomirabilia bacterium]